MRHFRFAVAVLIFLLVSSLVTPLPALHAGSAHPIGVGDVVVKADVWVVLAGLGSVADAVKSTLKDTYESTLNSSLGLRLAVKLHVVTYGNVSELASIARRDAVISRNVPEFIIRYVRSEHPSWIIRGVELVRADLFERDAWVLLTSEGVVPNDADYVLLVMYAPPPQGYFRTYYISRYVPEVGGYRNYTGMINFGGNTPLYFIDLSAIPAEWPNKEQPGYSSGIRVNATVNPPLWDVGSPSKAAELVRHYVEGYIGFLVARKLFAGLKWVPRYVVNVTILDFSAGREGARKVLRMLNPSTLEVLLHALLPSAEWGVYVTVVNGNATPFRDVLLEGVKRVDGYVALNASRIYSMLEGGVVAKVTYVGDEAVIPVYVLVGSHPLCMYFGSTNFTGMAMPGLGIAIAFPGYARRAYELGMDDVIAHEVGHMLGLPHPFDRMGDFAGTYPPGDKNGYARWWFFDFVATPMSYAPTLVGWDGGVFYYDAKSLSRYVAAYLLKKALAEGVPGGVISAAMERLSEDRVMGTDGAVSILRRALSLEPVPATITVPTVTSATTITKSVPATVTEVRTETTTVTVSSVATVTSTVTLTTQAPTNGINAFAVVALSLLGFVTALTLTLAVLRRRT